MIEYPTPWYSLLYTSCRPEAVKACATAWCQDTTHKIDLVMVYDKGDEATAAAMRAFEAENNYDNVIVRIRENDGARNCVAGWNAAAAVKSDGDILIAISDDFTAFPGWDAKLAAVAEPKWWEEDRVVLVSDGCLSGQDVLMATLGIMTRTRCERQGFFWYPGYESMWVDNELAHRAHMDCAIIEARHLTFQHHHYCNNQRKRDGIDDVHGGSVRFNTGKLLFELRQARGFPIDAGPMADMFLTGEPKFVAYMQCIRDDFGLQEVCDRLFEEGVRDFMFSIPDEYWDGRKQPPEEKAQVMAVAYHLSDKGATVKAHIPEVAMARVGANNRIEVETRVRNSALDALRNMGYAHALIVDGDELWRRGLLAEVRQRVIEERPSYLVCKSVPVAGCPGFPVNDAKDKVAIYIRTDNRFTSCRAAYSNTGREIQGFPIIHFSAVRKTKEELIAKMRASGHYDDPDYDFEKWIEEILPNLREGFTGVHMYNKGQENIWPEIRLWTPEELDDIPVSLLPYLCQESRKTASLPIPAFRPSDEELILD